MQRFPQIRTTLRSLWRRASTAYWRTYWRARAAVRRLPRRPAGGMASNRNRHHGLMHPGYGLEPDDVFPAFIAAEQGDPRRQVALFDDLRERDATARNLFEQRIFAVSGMPWVIQAGGDDAADEAAAAALNESVRRIPGFGDFIEHQLSFNAYGYAASELAWCYRDGLVEIDYIANVHADRFRIATPHNAPGASRPGDLLIVTDSTPMGEPLRPGKWVISQRPGSMPLARRGLMRTCAWYCMFKLFAIKTWVAYAERFGIPLTLAKIGDWDDEETKRIAREIVARIGDDGGAVVTDSVGVEIHDGGRKTDKSDVHGGLIAFCNAENSRAVYGVTLANDNGQGGGASFALGTTHAGIRWENVIRDASLFQHVFEHQIALPFMHFNGMPGKPPIFRMQVAQSLSPEQIVRVADSLVNKLGMDVSAQQLRHMLGFRAPLNDKDSVRSMKESA